MSLAQHYESLMDDLGEEPDAIVDLNAATAVLHALGNARRRRDDAIEVATAQVAQVASWLEGLLGVPVDVNLAVRNDDASPDTGGYCGRIASLEQRLALWHAAMLERDPSAKSIALPSGTLASRLGQPTWLTEDEKLLPWLQEHYPETVVTPPPVQPEPRIDRNAMKDALTLRDEKGKALAFGVTPDGEHPPGLSVLPPERKYEARTDEF